MSDFYSAVFFDMDGLFVDSEPQWLVAETELMAEFGYEWTSVDQNYCLGGPLTRVGKYMFEKAGSIESPDFFTQSIIKRMVIRLSSGAPVLPGALELLRDLQANNVPTALVSASPRVLVDSVLKRDYLNLDIVDKDENVKLEIPEMISNFKTYTKDKQKLIYNRVDEISRLILRGVISKFDDYSNEEKERIIEELYP